MLFTKASEYALFSLVLVAQKQNPVDVDTISKELSISKSFLAKILQSLARDGILLSFKGNNGGFLLAKNPIEITLKDIIASAEKKPTTVFECSHEHNPNSKRCEICKIRGIFDFLQNSVDDFLDTITLKEIIEGNVKYENLSFKPY